MSLAYKGEGFEWLLRLVAPRINPSRRVYLLLLLTGAERTGRGKRGKEKTGSSSGRLRSRSAQPTEREQAVPHFGCLLPAQASGPALRGVFWACSGPIDNDRLRPPLSLSLAKSSRGSAPNHVTHRAGPRPRRKADPAPLTSDCPQTGTPRGLCPWLLIGRPGRQRPLCRAPEASGNAVRGGA